MEPLTHQYPHLLLSEQPGEQRRNRQTHFRCAIRFGGRGSPNSAGRMSDVFVDEAAGEKRGASGAERSGRFPRAQLLPVPRPGQRGVNDVTV